MVRVAIASIALVACGRVGFDARTDATFVDGDGVVGCATERAVPTTGLVAGTLIAGASTTEGTCDGTSTSEDVWTIDVDVAGSALQLSTDQSNMPTSIYVRTACTEAQTEVECDQKDGIGGSPLITRDVPPGRYYVFVDGQGTDAGGYEGVFQVLLPINAPCDGSNMRDRCGPSMQCVITSCKPQTFPCAPPNAEVLSTATNPIVVTADTRSLGNFHAAHLSTSCGEGGDNGNRGNEKVYQLDLASAVSQVRVSTISTSTDFDTLIYARESCTGPDLACNDDFGGDHMSQITLGPLAAGTYFLFIDAFGPQSGRAEVTVTITP